MAWIAKNGGMALVLTHPDYMNFGEGKLGLEEYPAKRYEEFLEYVKSAYEGSYWHALPMDVARFFFKNCRPGEMSDRRKFNSI